MNLAVLTFADVQLDRGAWSLGPVTLSATRGEIMAIVGASGSGKSSLLRLAAGLEVPSRGYVWNGDDTSNGPLCSMVFQDYILYPHLSVRDNALLRGRTGIRQARNDQLERLAQALGLSRLLDRRPRHLSGGERQRAAILKTLVSGAPLWLLDEPLSNLDGPARIHVRALVRDEARRCFATVLWVTHDVAEALTVADRLLVLRDGVVLQQDVAVGVLERPATIDVARLVFGARLSEIHGQLRRTDAGLELHCGGCRTVVRWVAQNPPADVILTFDTAAVTVLPSSSAAPSSDALQFSGSTTLIEHTPREKLYAVRCEAADAEFHVAVPASQFVAGQLAFTVSPDAIRLYDASTGRVVPLSPSKPQAESE